jgi:hypothetical protein
MQIRSHWIQMHYQASGLGNSSKKSPHPGISNHLKENTKCLKLDFVLYLINAWTSTFDSRLMLFSMWLDNKYRKHTKLSPRCGLTISYLNKRIKLIHFIYFILSKVIVLIRFRHQLERNQSTLFLYRVHCTRRWLKTWARLENSNQVSFLN